MITHGNMVARWRELYDESAQARSWLEAHRWSYGPQVAQATIADVRRKLLLDPNDRVLEVGAGSGAFLMGLLHDSQKGVGLDLCESLVRESARFGVDTDRIHLGVAEGLFLPIRSDTFDKVLCYSVAHHFPSREYARGVIGQLVRVCRVGGIVLLGDVCGVMERHRRSLLRNRIPRVLADALIAALLPIRYIRWSLARRNCPHWSSTYSRRFFEQTLKSIPCEFEIIDGNIPNRPESLARFDVRIIKKAPLQRVGAMVAPLLWTLMECGTTMGCGLA